MSTVHLRKPEVCGSGSVGKRSRFTAEDRIKVSVTEATVQGYRRRRNERFSSRFQEMILLQHRVVFSV